MNDEIKEIDNSDLMELLETTSKKEFYRLTLDHELVVRLYNWITNLQEEKTRIRKILTEHIEEARHELNVILQSDNDLHYKNECSIEFEILNKNIRMILNKIDNNISQGSDEYE